MSRARKIREHLGHPVVDADGHWLELQPVFMDYIADIGGPGAVDRYRAVMGKAGGYSSYKMTVEERFRRRIRRQGFWAQPTKTEDRAAAMIKAFSETLTDSAFIADAAKIRLSLDPLTGEEIMRLLDEAHGAPKDVIDRAAKFSVVN